MASVEFAQVSKSFGDTPVLRDVSIRVEDGEFLTLLGPSGCGKSTLLRILAGLERQDAGTVAIGGRSVDHLRPKDRGVSMVFQSYALYPHMTVAENIALPLRMREMNGWQRLPALGRFFSGARSIQGRIDRRVANLTASLEIGHLLQRRPGQLSGGQRQRVAVGRAMVLEPRVLLMDEPLSNLDAKLRVHMRTEIKELHRRLGMTFVYVTHDQAEAMTLSDRIAVMLDGEILEVGSAQDIYASPDNRRVAEFVGSPKINVLPAAVEEPGVVASLGIRVPAPGVARDDSVASLGIRAEGLALTGPQDPAALSGKIRLIEHLGADILIHFDLPDATPPAVMRASPRDAGHLVPGQVVHARIDADQVLLFDRDGRRRRPAAPVPLRETGS